VVTECLRPELRRPRQQLAARSVVGSMGAAAAKPVCCAAQDGHLEEVRAFLDGRCDPNERDELGTFSERVLPRTLLMYAAQHGHAEVVGLLLNYGADVFLKNEEGATAGHLAAANGHIEPLAIIAEQFPEALTAPDGVGSTVLHVAAGHDNEELVAFLIGVRADCSRTDERGNLPLHCAQDLKVLDTLLVAWPDSINQQNGEGYTVLHLSAKEGKHQLVESLLDRKADPSARTSTGRTALRLACSAAERGNERRSHLQCAALLLGNGACVEPGDALAAGRHRPLDLLLQGWAKRQPPPPPAPPKTETEKDVEIARLTEAFEAMERARDEEAGRISCCICMGAQRRVLFLPCAHIVCCQQCADCVSECPVDRMPIQQRVNFTLA